MPPGLRIAEYLRAYRVRLKFADGVKGEIDLQVDLWGKIFEPFEDKTAFAGFVLNREPGAIVWLNEADFAPEFLYETPRAGYALNRGAA